VEKSRKQDAVKSLEKALFKKQSETKTLAALKSFGFENTQAAFRNFSSLTEDVLSRSEFQEILPALLHHLHSSPCPDIALNNFERFANQYFSKIALFTLLKKYSKVTEMIVRVFSVSQALSETLIRNPENLDWLVNPNVLQKSWTKKELCSEIKSLMDILQYWSSALNALRRFRRRMMLRIGVRDMLEMASVEESTRDLSDLADACIQWAYELSEKEMEKKYGSPRSADRPKKSSKFSVLGMGKLGGRELNYSSDIDVIFIYSEEGETNGGTDGKIDNHTFFSRLAEKMLQVLCSRTREGYLYRVDVRLRPEGDTGPLARSLEAYEHYYAQWGQSWERQALIKARVVGGDEKLGKEFLERISPFIYRKYMDYQAIEDMKNIKARIDDEVRNRGEENTDVKLGPGGIREIEFGVQIIQLLFGGKNESLRTGNSLAAISKLTEAGLMEEKTAIELKKAYLFLRKTENLLQVENERQTHVLPSEAKQLDLFSKRLGFACASAFLAEYERHRKFVFDFYKGVFSHLGTGKSGGEKEKLFSNFIRSGRLSDEEKKFLTASGFKDLDAAGRNLISLAQGENTGVFIKALLSEGFLKFLPLFLEALKKAFDADQALIRLGRFVSAYQSRDSFFALLAENPKIMELLVCLFGISPFLTEVLVCQPALLESLIESNIERPGLDEERHERCLSQIEASADRDAALDHLILYKNFELLRQGIRNILGLSSCMENVHELSLVAERVLTDAFEICARFFKKKRSGYSFPFAVIGLGKLGGQELGYASDLDLLFVTSGDVDVVNRATQFGTLFVEFLSKTANAGCLYKIDTRLRPDGSKGPLVTSLDGLKKYYQGSGEIWERMAMSRARWVAGDEDLGNAAIAILENFVFQNIPDSDEIREIRNIRERIYEDRCSRLPDGFDVKSGKGGLIEIEFLAQFLQLKYREQMRGRRQTHTLKLLQALSHVQAITREELGLLVDAYLFYREIEGALRLVKERPTDFVPQEDEWAIRIQKKIGLDADPAHFFEKLLRHTQVVRYIYERYVQA